MRVAEVMIGLIVMLLFAWCMILALHQGNLSIAFNNLANRQIIESFEISPDKCPSIEDKTLVKPEHLCDKEYTIIAGYDKTSAQPYICFYE